MKFYNDINLDNSTIKQTDTNTNGNTEREIDLRNVLPLAGGTNLANLSEPYIKDSTLYLNECIAPGRYYAGGDLGCNIKNTTKSDVFIKKGDYDSIELIVKEVPIAGKVNYEQNLYIIPQGNSFVLEHYRRILSNKTSTTNWIPIYDYFKDDDGYAYLPVQIYTSEESQKKWFKAPNIKSDGTIEGDSFVSTSDQRLKTNIKPLEYFDILSLPLYSFDYINGSKNQIGCLAQDLQKICPQLVHENCDGFLTIQENKLIYLLLNEIKQLKQELQKMRSQ